MLILISDAFAKDLPDKLARFGEVTDDKSRLPEADIVLVRSKTKCDKEYLDQAKNLKMIIRGGVGLDNVDRQYAQQKGVIVHNTPRASSIAVAELAFALMIAVPNRIIPGHVSMSQGHWNKKELKRTELFGKILGLIGVGLIGTEVAKRARAFGMKVIAYDKYVESHPDVDLKSTLDEVLAQADYVSLHTPLTPETEGMINKETLTLMKPTAVVLNTSRGTVIDEPALAEALKQEKILGAGLDVFNKEPIDNNNPLLKLENVVLSPHTAGHAYEGWFRRIQFAWENIQRVVAGNPPESVAPMGG